MKWKFLKNLCAKTEKINYQGIMMTATLYETDLAAWVKQQIFYLKNKQYDKIDIDNFSEEFEAVIRREKRELKSYLVMILRNILRIQYQPEKRCGEWISHIKYSRSMILELLGDSPCLRSYMPVAYEMAWKSSLQFSIHEIGKPINHFPKSCPWSLSAAMENDFDL